MQTYFHIWITGFFLMQFWLAFRDKFAELQPALFVAIFWPIAIALIPWFALLDYFRRKYNWYTDLGTYPKMFKYRLTPNPNYSKGFAITIFWIEARFWKPVKQ